MTALQANLKKDNSDPVFSFLYDIDGLMPAERLDRILVLDRKHKTDNLRLASYRLLIGLYGINQVIQKKTSVPYFFYVQNDESLLNLLDICGLKEQIPENTLKELIIALGTAQLIYRFNAALKFDLSNQKIKQLRINSWGRSLLEEGGILNAMKDDRNTIIKEFESYFDAHQEKYQRLTHILLKPINSELAEEVQNINRDLAIQIVS